jgi:hypothetical protein
VVDEDHLVPEEFVTKESVNYQKDLSVDEGVSSEDKTVKISILPAPPQEESLFKAIW